MTKAEENENKIVAQRYANAILEFADDKRLTKEQILSEFSDVVKSIDASSDIKRVMYSPVISSGEKKLVLEKMFEGRVDRVIINFLKLLVDKSRFSMLQTIFNECKAYVNKMNNLLALNITSAIELNDNEKAMVKVKLEKVLNKEIELSWSVDGNIIGGLVFEAGDNIVDCSLRKKIQEINKEINV